MKQNILIALDKPLYKRFKKYCVDEEKTMTDVVVELIRGVLPAK